jgi:hypothetical protein
MENVVNRFLMYEALALMALHPNQHDYQAGKSMEMALSSLRYGMQKCLTSRKQLWVFF